MFLKRLALLGVAGLAVLLVLIAGPRLMAGLELAESQSIVRQVRSGQGATFQGVRQAIESRRDAARWDPGPRAQAGAAARAKGSSAGASNELPCGVI